jgi:putative endonuclease
MKQGSWRMSYYVYILASRKDGAIYVGMTSDIVRRIYQRRGKAVPGFTSKYNITRLVWFETCDNPIFAITREKELKKWKRSWFNSLRSRTQTGTICTNPFVDDPPSFRDGPKDQTRDDGFRAHASRAPE